MTFSWLKSFTSRILLCMALCGMHSFGQKQKLTKIKVFKNPSKTIILFYLFPIFFLNDFSILTCLCKQEHRAIQLSKTFKQLLALNIPVY